MKQRFSSIDVRIIASELSRALGSLRVQNIYDLSSKIFLIKFSKLGVKEQLLIDNGFRCHLTKFCRSSAPSPSVFVQSLRKRLKSRRVTSVSHVGTDRVIEIQFSDSQYRLFLEFYAAGNIILTDSDLKILALLRVVSASEFQEELRVGLYYVLNKRHKSDKTPSLTIHRLRSALEKVVDKSINTHEKQINTKIKPQNLRSILATSITELPPMFVDHALKVTGFDSNLLPADILQDNALLDQLLCSMKQAQLLAEDIINSDAPKGYIIAKKKPGYEQASKELNNRQFLVYEDFQPFRPYQLEDSPDLVIIEIEGFNKTVDEFFSSIESMKSESKLEEREIVADRKLEAVRLDHAKRLEGLQRIQTLNERKAGAIQVNAERVQEAMDAVNSLIAQGMDWVEIGKLIEVEQRKKNSIALTIKLPLKLRENTITLILKEAEVDVENESTYTTDTEISESDKLDSESIMANEEASNQELVIDIDLGISPWANARVYFDERRSAIHKEESTLASSAIALKNQEAKIKENLRNALKRDKAVLRPIRQLLWFEKFFWFLSSDRYLVLAGKDTLQNEILYKKYLKKGDIYLNADIEGAAIVIIKNKAISTEIPVPPSTLTEAGALAVACSSAWDSKVSMSAWWVNAEQVSKSTLSGEYLPPGCFYIQGPKNYLPPSVLLLGLGVIFQVSDESKLRHLKHRIQDLDPNENSYVRTKYHEKNPDQEPLPVIYGSTLVSASNNELLIGSSETSPQTSPTPSFSQSQVRTEIKAADYDESNERLEIIMLSPSLTPEDGNRINQESFNKDRFQNNTLISNSGTSKNAQVKRGKKGKAKKIATKYKHQDVEDRIAAQKITGATTGQQKAIAEAAAKAARDFNLAHQKEKKKSQHEKTQKEIAQYELIRKQVFLGEIKDECDYEKFMILDNLFGKPTKEDELIEAIPVCAPLSAMRDYKYKVKIQPGATKRGKVAREVLNRWLLEEQKNVKLHEGGEDDEYCWPREIDLLRSWKVEEITGIIPVSKMRIMVPGQNTSALKGNGKQNTKRSDK